jgi:putative ABC transport system substrate-binding protein
MALIGVLVAESAPHPFAEAFRAGMRELGYAEGRNVTIQWRYANGLFNRAVELASELVGIKVDVIVAHHTPAVKASMSLTRTIPIVMAPAGAPLETGLVASLADPGGNVTGLSSMEAELGSKRIALLREVIPGLARVAVLGSKSDPFTRPLFRTSRTRRSGLDCNSSQSWSTLRASSTARLRRWGRQAVMIQPLFSPQTSTIVALAAKHHLAIMSSYRDTTQAGGLISYSADHAAFFKRAAAFVDKILKGAKPADLPVEQPTKFELVVNIRTAKSLGLTIAQSFLLEADEVVE